MKRVLFALALAAAAACSTGQPDLATLTSNSDQVIWEAGRKAFEKKQWESARQHFRRIIDGFPQSPFAPSARLALGESYVKEGGTANDILAIAAFREFLTLYPSHPRSDFAQLQVADGYFRQRNGPDRDQTNTIHALEEYQRLLDLYPSSSLLETVRTRIGECRQSLARAEFLAGFFYQRTRQACRAAISRYEGLLADYPDYSGLDEVLLRLAECLQATDRTAEALPHLARLLESYPRSPHAATARELMAAWAAAPAGTASPAPAPSPGNPVPPQGAPTPPAPPPSPVPSPAG